MNNIDILEDYINLIEKGYCEDCNELCNISTTPVYPSKSVAQAISNLLAKNKELKERNKRQQENLKITNKKIAAQRGQLMMLNKAYIPKSKVEEKIEEIKKEQEKIRLDEDCVWNNKIYNLDIAREVLQELLGKE